jgi:hypothetical protein
VHGYYEPIPNEPQFGQPLTIISLYFIQYIDVEFSVQGGKTYPHPYPNG